MVWQHFTRDEFKCHGTDCCGGQNLTEDRLIDALDDLRKLVGFPIKVTSGYRCPIHNQRVSSTGPTGPHTTGLAADLAVDRGNAVTVLALALDARDTATFRFTGFGINQKGSGRFIHLDMIERPTRTIWSY